jgi:hypothetical protein
VLGAWQAARDRVSRGGDFLHWESRPRPDDLAKVKETAPADLILALDGAIREKDQDRACAVAARYGALGHSPAAVFDLLRGHASTQDGALHAEKYYRTAREEFEAGRPAFRWRHVVSLARVTASEFGREAPGVAEATRLLRS